MPKIVLFGNGSDVFSRHLNTGIISYPYRRDKTTFLMDIAQESPRPAHRLFQ